MNLDGTIPADNPFPNSYVYSYGHRNPQGLVWVGGTLYASEHGPSAHDEINRITPGANYGWPVIQGDGTASGNGNPIVFNPVMKHGHRPEWLPEWEALCSNIKRQCRSRIWIAIRRLPNPLLQVWGEFVTCMSTATTYTLSATTPTAEEILMKKMINYIGCYYEMYKPKRKKVSGTM